MFMFFFVPLIFFPSQMLCTVHDLPVVLPSFARNLARLQCVLCVASPSVSPAGRRTMELGAVMAISQRRQKTPLNTAAKRSLCREVH